MDFGIRLAQSPTDVEVLLRRAQLADELGYHSVWLPDHLHWPRANDSPVGTSVETLTTMAAIAALTEHVQLGFTMLNPGFRPPAVLAKMLATIDIISRGRVLMTLGAGWYRKEYETYGVPYRGKPARYEYEREVAEAILQMCTHPTPETTDFEGEYFQLHGLQFSPPPFRKPHPPLWFGGDSRATQAMVADLADGWLMTAQKYEDDLREFRQSYPDFDRELYLSTQMNTCVSVDRTDALRRSEVEFVVLPEENDFEGMLEHSLIGTPQEVAERIRTVEAAGIDMILLLVADDATMVTFAEEVMPQFRSGQAVAGACSASQP